MWRNSSTKQRQYKQPQIGIPHGGKDLSKILKKIAKLRDEIVLPKTAIGQNGFMAHFI